MQRGIQTSTGKCSSSLYFFYFVSIKNVQLAKTNVATTFYRAAYYVEKYAIVFQMMLISFFPEMNMEKCKLSALGFTHQTTGVKVMGGFYLPKR